MNPGCGGAALRRAALPDRESTIAARLVDKLAVPVLLSGASGLFAFMSTYAATLLDAARTPGHDALLLVLPRLLLLIRGAGSGAVANA
jgi:hypothetical protein